MSARRMVISAWFFGAALAILAATPPAGAGAGPAADTARRVAALVDVFPAREPAARDALCDQILALGPEALATVLGRVLPPGHGDDTRARFAVNGLVVRAGRPGAAEKRALVVASLLRALAGTRDPNVAAFLLSQLQLVAGRESIRPLQKHLADPVLAGPAAAVLVTIGGPEATRALVRALDNAPAVARVTIVDALGRVRSREAVTKLLPLAASADPALRSAVLAALAASGDPAAGGALSRVRVDASYRERTQAPVLYLLYARRLVESGHSAEGLAAARSILEGYRRPGESHHAAGALALIVSVRREQALPELLSAMDAMDHSLRGAALELAAKVPGPQATELWIRKAQAAPPEVRAEIVSMLGDRGDAGALPFVRESLRATEDVVRLAAVPAAARLGREAVLPDLLALLSRAEADEAAVLERALLLYPGALVVPQALALLDSAPVPARAALIRVLGEKRAREAVGAVLRFAADSEPALREAALVALARLASEAEVPRLVAMLGEATAGDDVVRLREAIAAAVLRNPDPEARADVLLELLGKADMAGKLALLRVLPRVGGSRALQAVARDSASGEPELQSAAIGALARWPDASAADELLRIASTTRHPDHLRTALQGHARLVARSQWPTHEKMAAFEMALAVPAGEADRTAVLSAIASVREPETLRLLGRCLDKSQLRDAAAAALLELASQQAAEERWLSGHEAYSLLRRAEALQPDALARDRAARIVEERLREGGFVPLFDGRSLEGWKGLVAGPPARAKMGRDALAKAQAEADTRMREHWKATDGVLVFDGKGDSLCSSRDFGDFELLADWRIEKGGEGGVALRGSPQLQIRDAGANPLGSGGLSESEKGPSQPLEKADRPLGEWNAFRVVMIGGRVTVYLNDKRVVDEAVLKLVASGPIELQAHGQPLAFRNLHVRELPRDAQTTAASGDAGEGFVPLFNGRDLAGWTGNLDGYAVEDGAIVVHPERTGGNLYTEREYSDFVLRFDFKLAPAANNGIGIRAPLEGDAAYVGMELQVLEDGSPVYWGLQPYQYHGSIYGVVAARRGVLRPVGEWNQEEVTVAGRRVTVVVNGTTVVDADLDRASAHGTIDHKDHPGLRRASGHIGFLGHGSRVEFRDIRLRELK